MDQASKNRCFCLFSLFFPRSWDSAVGIAIGYGRNDRESGVRGQEFFSFPRQQTGSEAHPASYLKGTGGSFPRG
jgi:hypothetical protein